MKPFTLDTQKLLVIILFAGIFAMAARAPADSDLWWHLAAGDWMRQHGTIPKADPFSHTVFGQPWIEQGWLPDWLSAEIFARTSYAGLGVLMAMIVTVTFALSYLQSKANPFVRAFALLLAAMTSAVYWSMRPQIFSFLFFGVVLWILYRHKQGSRRIVWFLPPLFVLWANCHAAWMGGFIAIAGYLVGESLNRLLEPANATRSWRSLLELGIAAGVSYPLIALNPNGLSMLTYPFKTVSIGVLQDFIQEWAAPDFHQVHVQPFIWLLLLTVAAIGLAGQRVDFTDLILLAGFTYMGLMAGRNIALFALVAGPILATYGEQAIRNLWLAILARFPSLRRPPGQKQVLAGRGMVLLNWGFAIIVLLAAGAKAAQPLSDRFNEQVQSELFPAGAVDYLRANQLPGEMFNSYNWGGYLIWKLYPQQRVFIDGRTDLYDDAFIRKYLSVTWARPGWEDILREYHVGHIVIENQSFLSAYLALHPEWERVYQDDLAVIYIRRLASG